MGSVTTTKINSDVSTVVEHSTHNRKLVSSNLAIFDAESTSSFLALAAITKLSSDKGTSLFCSRKKVFFRSRNGERAKNY